MKYVAVPKEKLFILSDHNYWAEQQKELDLWCEKNFCVRQGMVVTALNEYGYLLFELKWR